MAEIDGGGGGGGKHKGKKRGKKLSTRVDFTPMVDLGFLLITFFMLTTSMNKPQTMEINLPVKEDLPPEDQTIVKESQTITLLLGKNDKIVYYFMKDGEPGETVIEDFGPKGIREVLLKENKSRNPIVDSIKIYKQQLNYGQITEDIYRSHVSRIKAYKDGLIVIIKAADDSKYKNMIDILDEMLICNIGRYAVVDITDIEVDLLKNSNL